MKNSSLFDIISPIMIGPSSSHTAGAVRLGLLAKNIYGAVPEKITFKLYNSYAQTGIGHGTDKGLLAGILSIPVDDVRIKNIFDSEDAKSIEYKFEFLEDFNRHPNAVDFIFEAPQKFKISGNSIGAGEIEITCVNDFSTKLTGAYDTILLVYKDIPGMISKVTSIIQSENINIASLFCKRSIKGEEASMTIALDIKPSQNIIEQIKKIDDIYMVRNIVKLEN